MGNKRWINDFTGLSEALDVIAPVDEAEKQEELHMIAEAEKEAERELEDEAYLWNRR